MLLKVNLHGWTSPRTAAAAVVTGGVPRRPPQDPAGVSHLEGYSRRFVEPPRLGTWRAPYRKLITPPVRRVLRLGRPPRATSRGEGVHPVGWTRPWRYFKFVSVGGVRRRAGYTTPPTETVQGDLATGVAVRRRAEFNKWIAGVETLTTPGYPGFRPRRQTHPVRTRRDWSHLTGGSPCTGLRPPHPVLALRRRVRQWGTHTRRLTRWCSYHRYHFGRTRRKLKTHPARRYYLLRRRRCRSYLAGPVTFKKHFRGVTRRGFRRFQPNRSPRGERAGYLVGDPWGYLTAAADWSVHTLNSRVAFPVEYNLNRPLRGYFKLEKRRRPSARRWKLGQHPAGEPHKEVRRRRWGWFTSTGWAQLVTHARDTPPGEHPIRVGPAGWVHWSVEKWGRSRWKTRPTRRAARVFVDSVKSGFSFEHDAYQWGRSSTSATGVMASVASEVELSVPRSGGTPPPRGVPKLSTRVTPVGLTLVWRWVFTPVWYLYAGVAQGWCLVGYLPVWGYHQGMALARAVRAGVFHLVEHPRRYLAGVGHYWTKQNPLFQTVGWVYSSWLVVYSSEDDQSEWEQPLPTDDEYDIQADEDFNVTHERDSDFDQLGGYPHTHTPGQPWQWLWNQDVDGAWDDLVDGVEDFVFGEIPYRVALFLRPFVDGVVRLPVWGVLEGVTLLGLTLKLEYHRGWHAFLTGGSPRAVKAAAVVGGYLLRGLTWAAVFAWELAQLDYGTFRVEVVCTWGWPWQEYYYLGWVCFCFLSSLYLVGPPGWRNFFFGELGPNYLAGVFLAGTGAAPPEDYQLTRPATPFVNKAFPHNLGVTVRDDMSDYPWEVDRFSFPDGTNFTYRDVRVILAQHYGYEDDGYDHDSDYELVGMITPLHLSLQHTQPDHTLGYRTYVPTEAYRRSTRDGMTQRLNRYMLDFPVYTSPARSIPYYIPGSIPRERQARFYADDNGQ